MSKKTLLIIAITLLIIVLAGILAGPIMSNVERPKYDVLISSENVEIRQYAPMIIAEVKVSGTREKAINDGFRILADYIFGNNIKQQEITMTAPVQQQANEKIAMTAPVQQQGQEGQWQVSFVMPSSYTLKTLPKPKDNRVTIKQIPAKRFAVIRFSGRPTPERLAKQEKRLMGKIEEADLQVVGPIKYAFYNPPWTLPIFRRNEIMVEVEEQ